MADIVGIEVVYQETPEVWFRRGRHETHHENLHNLLSRVEMIVANCTTVELVDEANWLYWLAFAEWD